MEIYWLAAYAVGISLLAVVLTVVDKRRAQRGAWRVPERTLLLVGALGGAAAMLLTMLRIRHKTRHLRFMIGLPLIIAAHIVLVLWALFSGCGGVDLF